MQSESEENSQSESEEDEQSERSSKEEESSEEQAEEEENMSLVEQLMEILLGDTECLSEFVSHGNISSVFPIIEVSEFGVLGFPLNTAQFEALKRKK